MEENRVSGGFYHKFINYVMNPVVRGIKRITMGRNLEHTLSRRDSTVINIEQTVNGVDQNSSHVVGLGSSTPSPPVLKKGSAIVGGRQTQVQKGANTPHSSSKRIGGWFF